MFTQGLSPNAVRWVEEHKNEFPNVSLDEASIPSPSAPPFNEVGGEIDKDVEEVLVISPCTTDSDGSSAGEVQSVSNRIDSEGGFHDSIGSQLHDQSVRTRSHGSSSHGWEATASLGSLPLCVPTFSARQAPWNAVLAYDACVRLCLRSWAQHCMEASVFLQDECLPLRNAFGLQKILLQSEEELLAKPPELASEAMVPKPEKTKCKMKVQVRKLKMSPEMPSGCNFPSVKPSMIKWKSIQCRMSNLQSNLSSQWDALRKAPASGLEKIRTASLRACSSYEAVQEAYYCILRLKTSAGEDNAKMKPGSGESHTFFPESLADDLLIEIHDSKGNCCGHVLTQVATIASDPSGKHRWWFIYREPEHELVGRLQLCINFTTIPDETITLKCCSVAETVAYDLVLEAAMKVQHFQQRNLLLHGPWKWLLTEFASYYGVSDAYTRLRYISHITEVATPTADCLNLVYNLLSPIILEGHNTSTLSPREGHMLGEIKEQIQQLLAVVFENYKSLDESAPKGLMDMSRPATGYPAPALISAVNLYSLLHDIFSPEAQLKLCSYIQVAAKKRSRRHLAETDEFVAGSSEKSMSDPITFSTVYRKMKQLCLDIRNEIYTDIEIHNQHVLPSSIDLPNVTASIYSAELCNRLRKFLVTCPPTSLSAPVADLAIETANLQTDLNNWKLCPLKGGVDARELFHSHIILWIQDKRLSLLESCKLHRVKWLGVKTRNYTAPFVDEMFDRLAETVNEYEIIICRWPEYTSVLENAIADVEMAVVDALDKQYADALAPFKDAMMAPRKFALNYVKKVATHHSMDPQNLPEELGILLHTLKRLIDVLLPKIERELKSKGSCQPASSGSSTSGEHLSEVAVMQRAKFRNYLQAVVEKLAENTRLQRATKLKRIIQDSKDNMTESEIQTRMQPLKDRLLKTIYHLHRVFERRLFVTICRGLWDRLGQDVLYLLEDKEIQLWCRSSRIALDILDDAFASQMQRLLGNALPEEDLEPPRSIMEARSILCKDALDRKDYY